MKDSAQALLPILTMALSAVTAIANIYFTLRMNARLKKIDVSIKNKEIAFSHFRYYSDEILKVLSSIQSTPYIDAESAHMHMLRERLTSYLNAISPEFTPPNYIFEREDFTLESDFDRWKVEIASNVNDCMVKSGEKFARMEYPHG